jgi:hypothetical protein
MSKTIAAAALSAALLAGAASGAPPEKEREAGKEAVRDEIGKDLAELASGKRDPKALRVEMMWVEGPNRTTIRLFGNGVVIWDDRTQGRLSRDEVRSVASALNDTRFGAMPSQLGEESDKLKLRGKIAVSLAGKTKGVVQLANGDQSEAFSTLSKRILQVAGQRAKTGATASSLADALDKISTGVLAPEVLRVTAVRRPEKPGGTRGWLLQIEGRQATVRPFEHDGMGRQKRLELSEAESRSLVGALKEGHPETLTSSLFASDYTEVRIDAFQWTSDTLARRSPGVTQQTHGDRQRSFDRIVEHLARLADRVESKGSPD